MTSTLSPFVFPAFSAAKSHSAAKSAKTAEPRNPQK